ncbi:hypothetical protein D3C77_513020 [compost metagenome]
MHGLPRGKVIKRSALAAAHVDQRGRLQDKSKAIFTIACSAVVEHGIYRLQALHRFTQRSGRQAAAITQAASGIDQHQLQVTSQAVMLHAVVAQDQVQRLTGQQCLNRTRAVRVDHQRHTATLYDQQRFITGLGSTLLGIHSPGQLRRLGAITATDHANAQALLATMFDQPENHRGFAGAADSDVTHHNHRYRRAVADTLPRQESRTLAQHHAAVQRL